MFLPSHNNHPCILTLLIFRLVISALEKVEPTRQCHRLVGGVLIEKNAGDVLASLRENLKNVLISFHFTITPSFSLPYFPFLFLIITSNNCTKTII